MKIIHVHVHLKYIWNKSTKNLKETLKALRGVDFTKVCTTNHYCI